MKPFVQMVWSCRIKAFLTVCFKIFQNPFIKIANLTSFSTETIIHHNFPNEVNAGDCEPQRCVRHSLTYDVPMPLIIALIEQSAECRQFIKVFVEN